jgi:hypothetical protein
LAEHTEKLLWAISAKLNVLISLLIAQSLGNRMNDKKGKRKARTGEAARFLADMGLDTKDIATILHSPVTSIRTLLTPKRRK